MSAANTLRARFPEWKNRPELASLNTLLESALSFLDVPKVKRAAIAKTGRLNSTELALALRRELGKEVVPELRRIRRVVDEDTTAIEQERKALATQANQGAKLNVMKDREEALALVRAATEIGIRQIRSHVGMDSYAFEHWLATADGTEARTAA